MAAGRGQTSQAGHGGRLEKLALGSYLLRGGSALRRQMAVSEIVLASALVFGKVHRRSGGYTMLEMELIGNLSQCGSPG